MRRPGKQHAVCRQQKISRPVSPAPPPCAMLRLHAALGLTHALAHMRVLPGDGAGILVAMPDSFLSSVLLDEQAVRLPPQGEYAVGQVFLPRDEGQRGTARCVIERVAARLGHDTLTWRRVPTHAAPLGASAVAVEPVVEQWFLSARGNRAGLDTEQQLFLLRKFIEAELREMGLDEDEVYFCSLSSATLVYKGQLTPEQVWGAAACCDAPSKCCNNMLL